MKDLFQLLASNEGKTPDQIVAALNSTGWIHFRYLTQELADKLADKQMVLVKWNEHRLEFRMEHSPRAEWEFWGHKDLGYFNEYLQHYWGILTEEYTDGDLPDPPA